MRGYPERVMNESGPGAPAVGAAATVAAAVPSRSRQLSVLLGTAAGVFVLDHLSKWLVTQHLALGSQVPASGPITIHHIENRGAAFGLFPQLQVVFLVVAAAVALYILFAGRRFGQRDIHGEGLAAAIEQARHVAVERTAKGPLEVQAVSTAEQMPGRGP